MSLDRRQFLTAVAAASAAGGASTRFATTPVAAATGSGCDFDSVPKVEFYSSASQIDPQGGALTDLNVVAVWAEPAATNTDDDGNGDAYIYDETMPIPLVSVDGAVYGFGAILLQDSEINFDYGNEEFVLNAWDAQLGGSGTVLYDEGHGQFYTLDKLSTFHDYAENNGYDVQATRSLTSDLSNPDAAVITTPSESFTSSELDDLATFVSNGGALYLHDQSDYGDYDETANLNDVASRLDLAFRFNDDDVIDDTNNTGDNYDILTHQFNTQSFDVFDDRSGIGFDAGVRYSATVTDVTDGDTVDVEFSDGSTAELRLLGYDSAETKKNNKYESVEEWEGIEDDNYLADWGENAKDYATAELDGQSVEVEIDPAEDVWDPFGRLLAYVHYDKDGDGTIDTLFNADIVREGYARVYGSNLEKHDDIWNLENDAQAIETRVWGESDPENPSEVRDRSVEELFLPKASTVRTDSGAISGSRVPVFAESTATQDLHSGVDYAGDLPLVGVDADANVALVGGPSVDEEYHSDVSDLEHETFLTNLLDDLSDTTGQVLVEGGHGQFNEPNGLSSEDAVNYQRYLEGQGLPFEQVNSLDGTGDNALSSARALVLTPPRRCYTTSEADAVSNFLSNGGAVVALGCGYGRASPDTRANLNDLLGAIGTDLRLNGDNVFDDSNNAGDPSLVTTANLNTSDFSLFGPYS